MPIVESVIQRQRRLREAGIIRLGDSTPAKSKSGKDFRRGFPLWKFRLSSNDKTAIEAAAAVFGGEVRWVEHLKQWDVVTDRTQLKAYVSLRPIDPGDPFGDTESLSQWFELYEKPGAASRRCDGQKCQVWENGQRVVKPCLCDHTARKCKLSTKLRVMLPEIVSDGLWRLNTGSEVFDQEVHSFMQTIEDLGLSGGLVPVVMTYEKRQKAKDPNSDEQAEVFPVVALSIDPSPVSLPRMVDEIRRAVLAPPSYGERSADALPPSSAPELPQPQAVQTSGAEGHQTSELANGRLLKAIEDLGGSAAEYEDLVRIHGKTTVHIAIQQALETGIEWNQMAEELASA